MSVLSLSPNVLLPAIGGPPLESDIYPLVFIYNCYIDLYTSIESESYVIYVYIMYCFFKVQINIENLSSG